MSNGNRVFSRGENPMGMFAQHNVHRANQRSNPQRCRRRMRTPQERPLANGVAMSEADSLVGSLSVPTEKCQTTTMIYRRVKRLDYRTIWKWKSPSVTCLSMDVTRQITKASLEKTARPQSRGQLQDGGARGNN